MPFAPYGVVGETIHDDRDPISARALASAAECLHCSAWQFGMDEAADYLDGIACPRFTFRLSEQKLLVEGAGVQALPRGCVNGEKFGRKTI